MAHKHPWKNSWFVALVLCASFTFATNAQAQGGPKFTGFGVQFSHCVESIGVTLVPTDEVRPLVPSGFVPVGEGGPVTPLVVRTFHGDISVDGKRPNEGSIVQIGALIIPPDFTGDINNYTLWYYTSDAQLASHLSRIGVPAQHVERLGYVFEQGEAGSATLHVSVPLPGRPSLRVDGAVFAPVPPSYTFLANWWYQAAQGTVKMSTLVPEIATGAADLVLTTTASSTLGLLIGGSTTGFPIIQQFNTFPTAQMQVTRIAP